MAREYGKLLIYREGELIQTFLLNKPVIRIGRQPDCDLQLSADKVSRNHAEIRLTPQGPLLTDTASANGTYITPQGGSQTDIQRLPAQQPFLLKNGNVFRIAHFTLTYQAPGAVISEPAAQENAALDPPTDPRLPQVEPVAGGTTREPVMVKGTVPARAERPLEAPPRRAAGRPHTPQARQPEPGSSENASTFIRYLPDIYQENDFLRRFLLIFEEIWEPLERRQDYIDMYVDPRTCPATLLPWLASWFNLAYNPRWPEARVRRLISQGMDLYRWRGTRYGLARMIEVCTGIIPTITEVAGQPHVFRIQVALQSAVADETIERALIEELIQTHKPAHAGYILEVIE